MMIRLKNTCSGTTSTNTSNNNNLGVNENNLTPTKKKYRKKPDPTAPKITRPCSECGKKFWSWKALFGHMRCHPERQWRGINPPPNRLQKEAVTSTSGSSYNFSKMSEDDHEAALSLLLLASGTHCPDHDQAPSITTSENVVSVIREGVVMGGCVDGGDVELVEGGGGGGSSCRFECSSCKKVFGSHQALGGHRASHKNVKGCFANTRNSDGVVFEEEFSSGNLQNSDGVGIVVEDDNDKMLMLGLGSGSSSSIQQQHKCNVCYRVFSSGQALGGHKRCHWEKFDDGNTNDCSGIDLNIPPLAAVAPPPRIFEGDSWSLEALDLRLGL